ncbi:MAG: hypothetical protein JWQ02_2101 [Capsulimonas sp.]|jgi:hypothetical protein|nr:hypothetical protein [Capsulimonas sp.]
MEVFVLEHMHTFDDGDQSCKMIGVYSFRELAELAMKRLRVEPGFCDAPDGFAIRAYTVDKDTNG